MKSKPEALAPISRRDFLKKSSFGILSLAALDLACVIPATSHTSSWQEIPGLGRVLESAIPVLSAPRSSASQLHTAAFNTILNLQASIEGEANAAGNTLWFQLAEGGFVHSGGIQEVENLTNPIVEEINPNGMLAMVTVPFTRAWKTRNNAFQSNQTLYYGSNHWVSRLVRDENGTQYYTIRDDRWSYVYYVQPSHLRLFSEAELDPLSSSVPDQEKRIEVDLTSQSLQAFEGDRVVFSSPLSSGYRDDQRDYSTPPGEYQIRYKRPSRHMVHSGLSGDRNPALLGVPWVSYFTTSGIAFHGTYWHNQFGIPRSYGCLNLPIPAARWIYLWSQPEVAPRARTAVAGSGTRVIVR